MKKFALLLVTVLLVLSCKNQSRLLLDVKEVDFVNKSDVTLHGTEVGADWPLDIQSIAVCDSFLLVLSGQENNMFYVYSDELELKGRFCNRGRARNEFTSAPAWFSTQILRDARGDAIIPLQDRMIGVKAIDLQRSLEAQSAVIAVQNDYRSINIIERRDENTGFRNRITIAIRNLFLDNDINRRFEYYNPVVIDDVIYNEPRYVVTQDTTQVKEIRLLSRFEALDFDYVGGNLCKHPSRNLIVQPFRNMDYIMFFDLDNDRNFAVHQVGSLSLDDDLPIVEDIEVRRDDGTLSYKDPRTDHFVEVACTESFFMVTYYSGDYTLGQPDPENGTPELLFFDWDGNFLKSVKLDTHVSRMTYDEKNHILYTVDFNTDSIYSYDLVSFV